MTKIDKAKAGALAALGIGAQEQARRMPTPISSKTEKAPTRELTTISLRVAPGFDLDLDRAVHLLRQQGLVGRSRGEAVEHIVKAWLAERSA